MFPIEGIDALAWPYPFAVVSLAGVLIIAMIWLAPRHPKPRRRSRKGRGWACRFGQHRYVPLTEASVWLVNRVMLECTRCGSLRMAAG